MSKFDEIRPFHDGEVNAALQKIAKHPMMKALMNFTFPDQPEDFWLNKFNNIHSISEFQQQIISQSVRQILSKSAESLSHSGFDGLEKDVSYLFVSNHRDIVLDTSLLNLVLLDENMVMTASAIGDNLVEKNFLHVLAKLNRNFLVQRGLPLREQLSSSKLMSEYIEDLILKQNRSVWIAQREGRTKDGNDATQQGVLKMITMAAGTDRPLEYLKKLRIVPLSISYEYDPTDILKIPQMIARDRDEVYIKEKDEDFKNMMSGVLGQKKRIHLHAETVLDAELDVISETIDNKNRQLQAVADIIDRSVIAGYHLWPTNYIACDVLNNNENNASHYSAQEKELFERRLKLRLEKCDEDTKNRFLEMYSNPLKNKIQLIKD